VSDGKGLESKIEAVEHGKKRAEGSSIYLKEKRRKWADAVQVHRATPMAAADPHYLYLRCKRLQTSPDCLFALFDSAHMRAMLPVRSSLPEMNILSLSEWSLPSLAPLSPTVKLKW
jgi:hypothetical protein